MEFENILHQIIKLARIQFAGDKSEIGESTTASDIAEWNSLSHVMLVTYIEKTFGIKFDLLQMIHMKSIGDIARATSEKLK